MDIFLDALWDTVKDSLIILPLLYLTYLLVGYFSHNDNEKYSKILHHTNKVGPVIGALLGSIPQCGFSSVMSNLFSKKIITIGTLIAVFIATSDEALPLMISRPEFIPKLLLLMAIKIVFGIIIGYGLDIIVNAFSKHKQIEHEFHDKYCHDGKEITYHAEELDVQHKHHHKHDEDEHNHSHCCATNIFIDALKHTAIILAYVFVATLIINLIRGYCGGLEPLKAIFTSNIYLQILLASVIGLIPNCASSVFLVEMYMEGVILFPAVVAGLSAGAGVGLIVLFTCNYKRLKINLLITFLMFIFALLIGLIVNFIPIW